MRLSRFAFAIMTGAAGIVFSASAALADVQYYRYSVSTYAPGPPMYTTKLPSHNQKGLVREVERDAQKRVVRVASYRDGKKQTETVYQFAHNAKFSSGYKFYRAGELVEIGKYTRNASGHMMRWETQTVQGTVTGSGTYVYKPDEIDETEYSADGKITGQYVNYYSKGLLIKQRDITPDTPSTYYERTYDTSTGNTMSQAKYENNKQVVVEKYAYDAYGDLMRIDLFDPSTNKPYGRKEYSNGLRMRDAYTFVDGNTKEIVYSYDSSRIMSSAKLSYNGALVCTFTFDRLPDGTVKRTLATGPKGDLWAEYPNVMVLNVDADGKDVDGYPGTIYKTGKWY